MKSRIVHPNAVKLGISILLFGLMASFAWCLEREHFALVPENGYESNLDGTNPQLRARQDRIFEALRIGDYEAFTAAAFDEFDSSRTISERDFKKLVQELSKLTKRSFRCMHGLPKQITPEGQRTFDLNAGSGTDSVIFRTYLVKLDGNRQSGRIHVFYNPKTWGVTAVFINRSPPTRSFKLPEPDPSHPLHPGKDFTAP